MPPQGIPSIKGHMDFGEFGCKINILKDKMKTIPQVDVITENKICPSNQRT
jgi:hypothetical protein